MFLTFIHIFISNFNNLLFVVWDLPYPLGSHMLMYEIEFMAAEGWQINSMIN